MGDKGRHNRRRSGSLSTVLVYLVLVAGIAVLAFPSAANWVNGLRQAQDIEAYTAAVDTLDADKRTELLAQAQAYNAGLVTDSGRFNLTDEELAAYEGLLNTSSSGTMAYVELPTLGERIPVRHGMSETVLQTAAGHMPGSSLPVGGEGTHAVLTGHRGLVSARLFTDIDQLKTGDLFYLHVLGETHAYEVDQAITVLPEETESLAIDPALDQVTLVTCTPYGVNTHRLLVRGHRVPVPDGFEETAGTLEWGVFEIATGAAALAAVTGLVIWRVCRRRKGPEAR